MSCSSCKYINYNDKKEGVVSGCCYYCNKVNSYVNGSNNECDSFKKSYRNNYECNKMFEDGEFYYNDDRGIELYLIILFILTVFAMIVNLQ